VDSPLTDEVVVNAVHTREDLVKEDNTGRAPRENYAPLGFHPIQGAITHD
jgi:hypothetical protein